MDQATKEVKAIVEAAGECWHEWKFTSPGYCTCGTHEHVLCANNPSPTDLNELFRLGRKVVDFFNIDSNSYAFVLKDGKEHKFAYINNPADAFRKALYAAVT